MALRPGRFLEMSSHFMPLPLKLMTSSFSFWDHFDCFLVVERCEVMEAAEGETRVEGKVGGSDIPEQG